MKKNSYRMTEYHKMVWQTAKRYTNSYFRKDRWSWFGGLFTGVFTGLVVPYLLYKLGGYLMPNIWLLILVSIISAVIGFALFVLVVCGVNGFVVVPAKIYRDLELEAIKRTWKDIEFKPFHFPENSGLGIGLEILSDKPVQIRITNVYCQITEMTRSYDLIFRGNMQIPLLSISSLQRTEEIVNEGQLTNSLSGQAIAVANDDGSRAWIQKNDATTDTIIEKDILHKLTISIQGNISDVGTMDWCLIYCDLLYRENKQTGQMEFVLTVTERKPKYEN